MQTAFTQAPSTLDAAFDTVGKATFDVSAADDEIYASAFQSDGKIVAVGYSGKPTDFTVVRYTRSGQLDTSFNITGLNIVNINGFDFARAVAIQQDGKIVVGGRSETDFVVARYTSTGQLDNTFGGRLGYVVTSFGV